MILFEYEGKDLLKKAGILVPHAQLISSVNDSVTIQPPLVLKAQVLSGKRAQEGGVVIIENASVLQSEIKSLLSKVVNRERVEKILVEEKADIETEYYISISYDTQTRGPILTLSQSGGTGVEEREVNTISINPLLSNNEYVQEDIIGLPKELINTIISIFFEQDCLLLEINPLVQTSTKQWIALDAKIKLDDFAKSRHEDWEFIARGVPGYTPTENEIAAKKIDEEDYRGTAGSSYFDLPGDIAVLSSGGGVSLTALDSLIKAGGKPSNFTEYSGNPPKEKVAKLTKVVLNKPNIHGLWVIGTVVANFTDIYETLSGLIEGLRLAQQELNTKFDFPIVIRRGGPRVDEAYAMLKDVKDFDLHLLGPETSVAQAAQLMAKLANEYAKGKS